MEDRRWEELEELPARVALTRRTGKRAGGVGGEGGRGGEPRKASSAQGEVRAEVEGRGSPRWKQFKRGLNGDGSGGPLARAIGEAARRMDAAARDRFGRALRELDARDSVVLTEPEAVTVLGLGMAEPGPWVREPERIVWVTPPRVTGRSWGARGAIRRERYEARVEAGVSGYGVWTPRGQAMEMVKQMRMGFEVPAWVLRGFHPSNPAPEAEKAMLRRWAMALGNGASARKLPGMPGWISRGGVHWAMQAPRRLEVSRALRWGELTAAGMRRDWATTLVAAYGWWWHQEDRAAADVLRTWGLLARWLAPRQGVCEERWLATMLWNAMRLGRDCAGRGVSFDLAGMTPARLYAIDPDRLDDHRPAPETWAASGVDGRVWPGGLEIAELTTRAALDAEGTAMRHCAGDYAYDCARHRTAVYSVRRVDREKVQRLATVELDLKRRCLVQLRAEGNRMACAEAVEAVREWASERGIDLKAERWFYVPRWAWAR